MELYLLNPNHKKADISKFAEKFGVKVRREHTISDILDKLQQVYPMSNVSCGALTDSHEWFRWLNNGIETGVSPVIETKMVIDVKKRWVGDGISKIEYLTFIFLNENNEEEKTEQGYMNDDNFLKILKRYIKRTDIFIGFHISFIMEELEEIMLEKSLSASEKIEITPVYCIRQKMGSQKKINCSHCPAIPKGPFKRVRNSANGLLSLGQIYHFLFDLCIGDVDNSFDTCRAMFQCYLEISSREEKHSEIIKKHKDSIEKILKPIKIRKIKSILCRMGLFSKFKTGKINIFLDCFEQTQNTMEEFIEIFLDKLQNF